MRKYAYLLIPLFLIACGLREDGITATPPVAESAVNEPEPAVPTAVLAAEPTETAVSEAAPPTPTAVVVATVAAPPAEPTATPLPTPLPEAPVNAIQLVPVASGFFKPVFLTHAFDARLFVVEQHGVIRIIENGQVLETPFLDIQQRVGSDANEQGLLSVAFHPQYGENGRFFVNYTDNEDATIIASFQVSDDPNLADVASEQILLTIPQPFANHNGGQIAFGPDGYLYIGMGDGGAANDPLGHGQDLGTLLGAMLRIDVDHSPGGYAIPADNPFVGDGSVRNEIWTYGLRNPWRFSFDRLTGDMFVADVGQGTWEEVHFQPANHRGGANYGWNVMEGNHCFNASSCEMAGLETAVFEYNHNQGHCSITGGYVYRGQQFPVLNGNYFVGDFCSGVIWGLVHNEDSSWTATQLLDSDHLISSFGEDAAGELYVLDHTGTVLQIRP